MTKDPATFDAARKLAANIAIAAKMNFEVNGRVSAFSFMLARKHPAADKTFDHPQVLPLPLDPLMSDKLAARRIQQEVVERTNAAWHVHVHECWLMQFDSAQLHEDCTLPISEHPQRAEAIQVLLEHESGQCAAWQLDITRDAAGNGVAGDPVEIPDTLTGTFTGYFKATRRTEVEA